MWRKYATLKKKQLHNYKQESIPVECIPPTCADHMCFFNSHQMSAVVREGFSGEQVWTCLQSWPSDVTRREGPGGDPLCIEIPCPGPRFGPCTVRSHIYEGGAGPRQALCSEVQCIMGNGYIGPFLPLWRDRHDWKHHLPTTSLAGGNGND